MSNVKNRLIGLLLMFGLMLSGLANAALPLSVATAATDISANTQAVFDLFLPVIILGVTLVVIIRLIKRFSSKV